MLGCCCMSMVPRATHGIQAPLKGLRVYLAQAGAELLDSPALSVHKCADWKGMTSAPCMCMLVLLSSPSLVASSAMLTACASTATFQRPTVCLAFLQAAAATTWPSPQTIRCWWHGTPGTLCHSWWMSQRTTGLDHTCSQPFVPTCSIITPS